jgi:crotonobetainyl-CoA:carnitine CoA-transferase CaiB-like acyl-CoA transferase
LGLAYEDLKVENPSIIYCTISGFGASSALREEPAFDVIAQAMSGVMDITGEEDRGPAKCGAPISDLSAGVFAALGIVSALFHRERTGEGQKVETSLLGATLGLLTSYLPAAAMGTEFHRVGSAHNTIAPYQAFRGSDGRYFIVAVGSDALWGRAAAALGTPELAEDPRFARNRDRITQRKVLEGLLQARFDTAPAEEWVRALRGAGVPTCLVHALDDVVEDRGLRRAGYITDVAYPGMADVPVVVAPLDFSKTPVVGDRPPPTLDQHREDVMRLIASLERGSAPEGRREGQ